MRPQGLHAGIGPTKASARAAGFSSKTFMFDPSFADRDWASVSLRILPERHARRADSLNGRCWTGTRPRLNSTRALERGSWGSGSTTGWKAKAWKGWGHERDRAGAGGGRKWCDRKGWRHSLAYLRGHEAFQGTDHGPYGGDGQKDLGQSAEEAACRPRQCGGDAPEGLARGRSNTSGFARSGDFGHIRNGDDHRR